MITATRPSCNLKGIVARETRRQRVLAALQEAGYTGEAIVFEERVTRLERAGRLTDNSLNQVILEYVQPETW